MTEKAKPAQLLKAEACEFQYLQRSAPANSNLDLLTFGEYRLKPGVCSAALYHHASEALLFSLAGTSEVAIDGRAYSMGHYDVLYVPLQTAYTIRNRGESEAVLAVFEGPARKRHPIHYAAWDSVRKNEERIRHLDGKDVFLMFDVGDGGDTLVAGYTIYEPHTRAWPPHNHTDQEEIYLFTKGHGAMEVYPDEESKTFVTSMGPMDAATIPVLNYHPVFSQDEEVHFIWCLAGARYWVGDKHKEFMDKSVDRLTT